MGAQREGGPGGRHRRGPGRGPHHGLHEARGPQRGGRPLDDLLLHRRQRRAGPGLRRRPRHAFIPERAGQPLLRGDGQGAHAGTGRQPGSLRTVPGRLRPLREVRHPGAVAHRDPCLPLPRPGGVQGRRAGRGRPSLRQGLRQAGDGARARAPAPPRPHREAQRPAGGVRGLSLQPRGDALQPGWAWW